MMRIYFPCFFNASFKLKIDTLIHELWHVGEKFDGRLRAYGKHFDGFQEDVDWMIDDYLRNSPNWDLLDWFDKRIDRDDVWGWKYSTPQAMNLDKILGEEFSPRKRYVECSLVKINL